MLTQTRQTEIGYQDPKRARPGKRQLYVEKRPFKRAARRPGSDPKQP